MTLVLDASIALSWCFREEQVRPVMDLLDRVETQGAFAPQLWPVEVVNGLLMGERRRRIDAVTRSQLSAFLAALPISIDNETVDHVWHVTTALAEANGLTAYDACYLELALRLQVPLATRDQRLAGAARRNGLTILPSD